MEITDVVNTVAPKVAARLQLAEEALPLESPFKATRTLAFMHHSHHQESPQGGSKSLAPASMQEETGRSSKALGHS